jgi:hypothetical protein
MVGQYPVDLGDQVLDFLLSSTVRFTMTMQFTDRRDVVRGRAPKESLLAVSCPTADAIVLDHVQSVANGSQEHKYRHHQQTLFRSPTRSDLAPNPISTANDVWIPYTLSPSPLHAPAQRRPRDRQPLRNLGQ